MVQPGLILSPFPSSWKSHVPWVQITHLQTSSQRVVVHPPLILQQKHFPLLQNEQFCLFALKVNIIQEYTSRQGLVHYEFKTHWPVYQSGHFILNKICHGAQGK